MGVCAKRRALRNYAAGVAKWAAEAYRLKRKVNRDLPSYKFDITIIIAIITAIMELFKNCPKPEPVPTPEGFKAIAEGRTTEVHNALRKVITRRMHGAPQEAKDAVQDALLFVTADAPTTAIGDVIREACCG